MLKTFYVQVDEVSRVTDIIEFPYQDYKEVQLNAPLPPNILGGAYKLIDGGVIYIQEWDSNELAIKISTLEAENETLKASMQATQQAVDFIVMNGGI